MAWSDSVLIVSYFAKLRHILSVFETRLRYLIACQFFNGCGEITEAVLRQLIFL